MAEITIQDVATYLAEHGYARWAELTARKMMTEEAMWTRLQSNYDSTRAIDSRYITFPTVDLSKYAKDADIKQWVQEQGYATTVPSLSGYATQQWVQQQGFLTQHQSLSGYATQSWVTARIQSSVSGFASQSWVSQNYATQAALGNYLPLAGGIITGSLTVNGAIIGANYVLATTLSDSWSDGTYNHPWYGIDHRYANRGVYSTAISDYYGMVLRTAQSAIAITQGGNIGINNYSPSCALDVSGTVKATSICVGNCTISYDNGMLHFSTGIYSDGAVAAGGVGTSGGSGGGGLSWANLAASTTEQIALSHLTTALSGYVSLSSAQVISGAKDFTSRIKVSDVGDLYVGGIFYDSYDWVGLWSQYDILIQSESDVLIDGEHIDINSVSGTYFGGAVSLSSTLTVSGQVTAKKFVATDYNSSDYLLTGDGNAISKSTLLSGYATTTDLHSHSNKSVLDGITSTKVSNWDTAYGWGNHATQGYLTSYGYRPIIGMSGTTTEWLGSNTGVILPLTSLGGGNYKLDYDTICSGYVKTSALGGIFTELDVSGTTLYVTVGGTRKSTTLPGGMSAKTSLHYASRSAFLQTYNHVTDEYGVIQCATVIATSGNNNLLAITLSDTEGQQFVIRATSGNKVLWKATTPIEQAITAIVWMNPSSYYTVEI